MIGKVYLVGAGPGDYKLLTLKALEYLKLAEVLVYDRLVNPDYLQLVPEGCEKIYVGKASSNHTMTQESINQLLFEKANVGKIVVRLKGGDPYVFGRGGEEALYLEERNIPFEVVPGITSAIGGLLYAGIPITHRDIAPSFHVITGHLKEDSNNSIQWKALVEAGGTLVFLMGLSNLQQICDSLLSNGMAADMPVAVINWATTTRQKVGVGNLLTIQEVVAKKELTSPSLIVVGKVVSLREKLNFFEQKPLFGKNIVVTRARAQSSDLKEKLIALGANVVEVPSIVIKPLEQLTALETAIHNLVSYTYLIFTSQNAVSIFFNELNRMGMDARALHTVKIVAIGSGTKALLKEKGICADYMPKRYIAESIVAELGPILKAEDRILIPRAKQARVYLKEALSKFATVEEIPIYDTLKETWEKEDLVTSLKRGGIDYITFTSSSTVTNFLESIESNNHTLLQHTKLVAIGDITAETLKDNGFFDPIIADTFTIDGVVAAIVSEEVKNKEKEVIPC